LSEGDEKRRAFEIAYRALAGRDRTESELRALLARRRVEPAALEAAVEEMKALRLVDDSGYARRFVEDRRRLDHLGSERIARDLERRGVARELIGELMAEVDAGEELEAAVALLDRRFPMPFAGDGERDKAWRLLVRRGYDSELAYAAVRRHERGMGGRAAA
jgi:regulatory protein